MAHERRYLGLLLIAAFAVRAWNPGQPIVENYVGRQVPTAMVARNLERGSGLLDPQLDTGPFPNRFLVEPPLYECLVVGIRGQVGFDWEIVGRLVSAGATCLGGWGLYGLIRKREGPAVALLGLASFCCFPVMVRYGRAFQPDALMLGCVLAGLRGWDEFEATGNGRWAAFGGFVLAIGLALKVTVAWALLPFAPIVSRWKVPWRILAAVAMLVPAGLWYLHAWEQLAHSRAGSLASFGTASIWLESASPTNWLRFGTVDPIVRGLAYRSFTPIGFVLAFWGLVVCGRDRYRNREGEAPAELQTTPGSAGASPSRGSPRTTPGSACGPLDRVWKGWAAGCMLSILALSSKWHHAYYWMVVAPLAAVGMGRALASFWRMGGHGRCLAVALGLFFLGLAAGQSASTFRTPSEWRGLEEAARVVRSATREGELIMAPEALVWAADRPGFRLEFDPAAIRRAMKEWRLDQFVQDEKNPLMLAEIFAGNWRGFIGPPMGRVIADVGPDDADHPRRRAWREALRHRPKTRILADHPDYFVAELLP